jgi:hypothetical protein
MDWLSRWPDLATYRGLNLAVLRGFSASGSGLETGEFSQGSYESKCTFPSRDRHPPRFTEPLTRLSGPSARNFSVGAGYRSASRSIPISTARSAIPAPFEANES